MLKNMLIVVFSMVAMSFVACGGGTDVDEDQCIVDPRLAACQTVDNDTPAAE